MGVVGATVGSALLWLVFAPLSGAVIAPGVVKVDSYRKTVAHLDGGIARAILVKEGDRVEKGQKLILLEDVDAGAAVELLQDQLDAETAKAARLEAERAGAVRIAFPPALSDRAGKPKLAELIQAESRLFAARRHFVDSQVKLLRGEAEHVREEILGMQDQIKAADMNLGYLKEELAANEALLDKKYVSYIRLLDVKRQVAEKQEKRGEYVATLAQARQKLTELELRIATLYDNYIREAADGLKETQKRLFDVEERLRPARAALLRQTIVAPIGGAVVGLKLHTVGGVVSPREPLMDIVPSDEALIIEAKVRVEDIAYVQPGGKVDIQLSAFKQRTTPLVAGRVVSVSADTLSEPVMGALQSYFLARIEVDKEALRQLKGVNLSSGMPVVAFIKVQERPALHYFVEPVTDSLRRALREP